MAENTMRQADNEVAVEGILQEVRLDIRESANKEEYISGEIDIETEEGSVHTFKLYSKAKKKDGTENGIFKGLKTVKEEYLSVAKVGKEEADKVRITAGQLGVNDYVGGDDQLKSFPQLSTNFINRVNAGDEFDPKAEFEVELFVQSVTEEVKNDEETGRVKLRGYVPLFGGRIAPLEFVAEGEGAEYIRDTYETGHTVKIFGEIVNKVEITRTKAEVGFGKANDKIKRNYTREYLITGGTEPYEEDDSKAYKLETIKAALAEREVYLQGLFDRKKQAKTQPKKEEKKSGFGTKKEKKPVINTDDLPF
ncbi:MAG: hypothetical protein ACI4G0_03880, partial [Ruminococcus sp.]